MMEKINEVLQLNIATPPRVSIFGLFDVSVAVVISWGVTIFLVVVSILLTRNLKKVPGKGQVMLESAIGFLNGFCKENLGHYWRPFAPWLGTVALYVLCCNLVGLLGLVPPTKDLSVTATLALMSILLVYGGQFRYRGLGGGLKKFVEPIPLLLPINLMEVLVRPLSLCMRLFGNILAGHIVMEMIRTIMPVFLPVAFSLYFDLFDGAIQTIVFVFLTTLFLGEGIKEHE